MTLTSRQKSLLDGKDPVEEIEKEISLEKSRYMHLLCSLEHELEMARENRRKKIREQLGSK